MTNPEFSSFLDKLFIAFPSLFEWMKSTYKPEETQRLWRSTLEPYTLDECLSVVTRWATGSLDPFAAYERDKVHLLVRAIVSADRDRTRKRDELASAANPYREDRRRKRDATSVAELVGSTKAIAEGAAEHRKFLDGEIDWDEYLLRRDRILTEHGF